MRIAIVGCGTAGPAAALFLQRDGHEVVILERVEIPRGVGAGILLERLGQQVLKQLGLADGLERCSSPVRRVDARTRRGRVVMGFGYGDVQPDSHAWGVSRGALFDLLWDALGAQGIAIRTGVEINALRSSPSGWMLSATGGESIGPFDLVIGADGARSRLRRISGLARKNAGYPYGALWCVVPDPDELAADVLWQRYDGTRTVLGVLPTGINQASIFWSVRSRDIPAALTAGPRTWIPKARMYAGHLAPLLDAALGAEILGARYRDVVVRTPVLVRGDSGLVLLGDAAHAMSPQLGLGASLALADAWTLAACLQSNRNDPARALDAYASARRAHIRYYTWCSRLMTPAFQSDLLPMGWGRDLLIGPAARIPWVRQQFVTTLMGIRTSPWTLWTPPEVDP